MFTCFVCKTHHKNCSLLCQHLKFQHGLYPAKNLRLKCGEQGCPSSFCTYNGFRKHLNNVHSHHHDEQVDTNQEEDMQRHSDVEFKSSSQVMSQQLLHPCCRFPLLSHRTLLIVCAAQLLHTYKLLVFLKVRSKLGLNDLSFSDLNHDFRQRDLGIAKDTFFSVLLCVHASSRDANRGN